MLRSLALLPEMEIDELANLAQRVASAAAQAEEDEAAFEDAPGGLVCCDVPGALAAWACALCLTAVVICQALCRMGLAAVVIPCSLHLVHCCLSLPGILGLSHLLSLLWMPFSAGCTKLGGASVASGMPPPGRISCSLQSALLPGTGPACSRVANSEQGTINKCP